MAETVRLYRIENPNIPAQPDGLVSHEDLVGQWFSPNLISATSYIKKATQIRGLRRGNSSVVVNGAQLVMTDVPVDKLRAYHVSSHPIAKNMDVDRDNYIIPPDAGYPTVKVPLDDTLGELRGHLGGYDSAVEARRRVSHLVQELAVKALA
jgi:hypothetical protein